MAVAPGGNGAGAPPMAVIPGGSGAGAPPIPATLFLSVTPVKTTNTASANAHQHFFMALLQKRLLGPIWRKATLLKSKSQVICITHHCAPGVCQKLRICQGKSAFALRSQLPLRSHLDLQRPREAVGSSRRELEPACISRPPLPEVSSRASPSHLTEATLQGGVTSIKTQFLTWAG